MYQKQQINSNYLLLKYPNVINLYAQYQSGLKPLDFKKNCVFQFIETTLMNPTSKNYQYLIQNNTYLRQCIIRWLHEETGEGMVTWSSPDKISRMMMHRLCAFYGLEHNVEIADAEMIKIEYNHRSFNRWACSIEEWGEYLNRLQGGLDERSNYAGIPGKEPECGGRVLPVGGMMHQAVQTPVWSTMQNPVVPAHAGHLMSRVPPQWLRPVIPVPGMPGYGWRIPLYLVAMPQSMLPNSSQVIPQQPQSISIAPNQPNMIQQPQQQQQPICITPVTNSFTSANCVSLSANPMPPSSFISNGIHAPSSSQTI